MSAWTEQWPNSISGHSFYKIQRSPFDISLYYDVPQSTATFATHMRTGYIITQAYLNYISSSRISSLFGL